MKTTDIKCPKCGVTAGNDVSGFQLVEPATAYRNLSVSADKNGKITQIEAYDIEHDSGDGDRRLHHRGCGEFEIPDGFWEFDIYG